AKLAAAAVCSCIPDQRQRRNTAITSRRRWPVLGKNKAAANRGCAHSRQDPPAQHQQPGVTRWTIGKLNRILSGCDPQRAKNEIATEYFRWPAVDPCSPPSRPAVRNQQPAVARGVHLKIQVVGCVTEQVHLDALCRWQAQDVANAVAVLGRLQVVFANL